MRSRLGRPSPSLVISVVALFVALGGTSYAAITITGKNIKDGSVTGRDIKKSSLGGANIKDKSLSASDFKSSVAGPKGATGATGPAGANGKNGTNGTNGADGTARAYAVITGGGNVTDADTSKVITDANITRTGTGEYCIDDLPFTPIGAVATGDNANAVNATIATVSVAASGVTLSTCPGGDAQLRVRTFNATSGALADARFNLWVQ